ncbi:MAG: hypothetical protein K1X28_07385 [Parachlamydiales bacterium]|nr:hypothetical protein [Parachlamydiales bacterium]
MAAKVVGSGDEFKEPFLGADFDNLQPPAELPPSSSCVPWGKRTVAVAAIAGSIVLRVANLYLATNAVASFGVGYAALYAVTCTLAPEAMARVRQVALPIIGQTSMFAFSQAWANDPQRGDQIAFDNTITACLGANMQIAMGWLLQQGAIRSESQPSATVRGDKLHRPVMNYHAVHALKLLVSAGFGTFAFLTTDPILRGVSSFLGTFFISQIIGERLIDKIDNEIEKRDAGGQGTRVRVAKTALLTLAYLAQIVSFVPWYNPSSAQRLTQMAYVGISLGFFDGVLDRSEMRRIERIPIDNLQELEKLTPPDRPDGSSCDRDWLKYQAYRIWKYSVPLIAMAGIAGFTLWQEIAVLPGVDPKVTLGAMLGGYLLGTGGCHWIDHSWDPRKRHAIKDSLMATVWFSPRILGIDPLFIYYAMTNAVKMDGAAIAAQGSPYHLAGIILGWLAYGIRMGHESFIGASDRIGSPQRKFPKMAVINGTNTTKLYIDGKN